MPGRTLSTWYGVGSGDSSNSGYPDSATYNNRHHSNSSPFDQSHYSSGSGYNNYYPVNQGGSTPSYSTEQRSYPAAASPSYQHFNTSPSPVASPYHYAEGSSTPTQQQMNFSNNQQQQQQQGAYTSSTAASQSNYSSANHRHSGQHSYNSSGNWGNYAGASPGQSPVMGSPSPASSNTSQSPASNMSGQFSQGAQAPAGHWQNHQAHAHGMQHQGNNHNMVAANMSPPPSLHSTAQYYQPNNAQASSPQQLDLSCSSSMQPVDLHSPGPGMHSPSPTAHSGTPSGGAWSRNPAGSSSPLASLQMLVNQDMNRQASAAYPPNSQGMVDLSLPRGNTPHQINKPEELRNGNSSTTTASPPALNGDLSSGADSGISSPMMAHLHPPDKPMGPRISVKSPQRLAAEVERQVRAQRATPSPTEAALNLNKSSLASRLSNCDTTSEPEGSTSPAPREARTKASMKRARKVDSLLETLVESGSKKKRSTSPPTSSSETIITPVICVPPNEDSGMMEISTSCPNSPNKNNNTSRSRSPACREDTVSPAFDDASQDSKPRRKRKPDNPTRLKSPEEGKNTNNKCTKVNNNKSDEVENKSDVPSAVSTSTTKLEEKSETKKSQSPATPVSVVDLSVKVNAPDPIPTTSPTPTTPPTPTPPPPPLLHTPPPSTTKVEASSSKPETTQVEQVESQLAKMFEGIESETQEESTEPEAGPSNSPSKGKRGRPKGSLKTEKTPETPTPKKQKKSGNKSDGETPSKRKRKPKFDLEDDFVPEPVSSSKKKKKKKSEGKVKGDDKKKTAQDTPVAPTVERCRGPYVRIEGPKDLPTNVTVYNSTRGDDEEGDRPASLPALKYRKKLSWHNERELRNRVQGLGFSSTMASQYDAFTADESWRCAFCKRGSHSEGLGDLFGPYFIQQQADVTAEAAATTAEDKKGKAKKKRRKSSTDEQPQKLSKKAKKELQLAEAAKKEAAESAGLEVWVHEPCAVWAAGVHLVGAHMVGLQEAVWGAANSICKECGETGANLGCVRRICDDRAHYICAKNLGWQLDEEGYVSCCSAHMRGVAGSSKKVMK